MSEAKEENQTNLSHWDLIRNLTLEEAALLMSGMDPAGYDESSTDLNKAIVYERAISEAVQRANNYAWEHARKLDMLMLRSEENSEDIKYLKITPDIWEISGFYEDYLPSIEIRNSVGAVNSDPENAAILLAIDPWYSATVYGSEFNDWLERSGIESIYSFKENQSIIVTEKESNWYSQQNISGKEKKQPSQVPLESAEKFAENIDAQKIPLSTRERNTLLSIVAALCKEAKIDYSRPAKAAALVKDLTVGMSLSIGESTIESHLKRIPDALEARMK